METAIVIIGVCFVVLAICGISTNCESTKNKYRIRDLEVEVEHLKDVINVNDKFVDKTYDGLVECSDQVRQLRKELHLLEGTQSKMADELWKMNDLDKRISVLENNKNIPPNIYGSICCDGTHCTNPFHDCVGCPNQFGSGGTYTSTSVGTKSTDE